jgi:hypothetical protein
MTKINELLADIRTGDLVLRRTESPAPGHYADKTSRAIDAREWPVLTKTLLRRVNPSISTWCQK